MLNGSAPKINNTGWPALDEAAVKLATIRIDAEIELVASLLASPILTVPFARDEGYAAGMIGQDDLRIIAQVIERYRAEVEAKQERRECALVIQEALQQAGHWDDAAPLAPPFSSMWCKENLAKLKSLQYYCRQTIRQNIARLKDIIRRQEQAEQHIAAAMAALTGEEIPTRFVLWNARAAA